MCLVGDTPDPDKFLPEEKKVWRKRIYAWTEKPKCFEELGQRNEMTSRGWL